MKTKIIQAITISLISLTHIQAQTHEIEKTEEMQKTEPDPTPLYQKPTQIRVIPREIHQTYEAQIQNTKKTLIIITPYILGKEAIQPIENLKFEKPEVDIILILEGAQAIQTKSHEIAEVLGIPAFSTKNIPNTNKKPFLINQTIILSDQKTTFTMPYPLDFNLIPPENLMPAIYTPDAEIAFRIHILSNIIYLGCDQFPNTKQFQTKMFHPTTLQEKFEIKKIEKE